MRPKESEPAEVDDERAAVFEQKAGIAQRVGAHREAERFRDIAAGIRAGAIRPEDLVFRPDEGPPSPEWVAAHRSARRWMVDRAAARGERPPPCWPCQGRYGSFCADIVP